VTRRRGGGEARRQDLGQAEAEEAQPNLLGPARESTTFLQVLGITDFLAHYSFLLQEFF
jgi:hypothetical protein